ncbi:MAG: ATP-binding cassette domain-containing protein [Deinococcota bacterium]
MSEAVTVKNVYKQFGKVHALNGANLNVPTGEVLSLLGPNGAGKTTLIRILTTLLHPDQGEVRVLGLDPVQEAERLRPLIGLAGQYAAVDENLTGRENLEMVARLYHLSWREVKRRTTEILERLSLSDAANRILKTYSGGMRRRLDLGASLVGSPKILFMDEPTTGLDPRTRQDLWDIIEDLVAGGTTLLLTTQYLEEADRLAKRIAVIDHGAVIAQGTSDELKRRFASDVLELKLMPQDLARAVQTLEGVSDGDHKCESQEGKLSLPVSEGTQSLLTAVRRLDEANITVKDVSLRRPTLDDVFLALTNKGTPKVVLTQETA